MVVVWLLILSTPTPTAKAPTVLAASVTFWKELIKLLLAFAAKLAKPVLLLPKVELLTRVPTCASILTTSTATPTAAPKEAAKVLVETSVCTSFLLLALTSTLLVDLSPVLVKLALLSAAKVALLSWSTATPAPTEPLAIAPLKAKPLL